jgi:hypothetical protein
VLAVVAHPDDAGFAAAEAAARTTQPEGAGIPGAASSTWSAQVS